MTGEITEICERLNLRVNKIWQFVYIYIDFRIDTWYNLYSKFI